MARVAEVVGGSFCEGGEEMKKKHYESCRDCALKLGATVPKDRMVCTVSAGKCPYCKEKNVTLIPHCDYDWPKEGKKAIFD